MGWRLTTPMQALLRALLGRARTDVVALRERGGGRAMLRALLGRAHKDAVTMVLMRSEE